MQADFRDEKDLSYLTHLTQKKMKFDRLGI